MTIYRRCELGKCVQYGSYTEEIELTDYIEDPHMAISIGPTDCGENCFVLGLIVIE